MICNFHLFGGKEIDLFVHKFGQHGSAYVGHGCQIPPTPFFQCITCDMSPGLYVSVGLNCRRVGWVSGDGVSRGGNGYIFACVLVFVWYGVYNIYLCCSWERDSENVLLWGGFLDVCGWGRRGSTSGGYMKGFS